ncbi:unnamed protein product [Rotaria sp. Silwood2]|nr:unnamed protein product [Rotaria sp. Silwood2]CAF4029102.1 unnamed protein product [Rotaria sp. Silwood2]
MCHIKSPSSSITIEHIIENPSNGIFYSKFTFSTYSLHTIIHKISSRILRYAYQWTKSINISSLFANLQFKIKKNLNIIEIYFIDLLEYLIPYHNDELIRLLDNLLYNEEENNLEIFVKYQKFDLEFKDSDDILWQMLSTSKQIKHIQPNIDENKVRMLHENVAQNQEQYKAYKQKKREELKKNLSETSMITTNPSVEYQSASGEQWVNEYLNGKYRNKIQLNETEIIWLNEKLEQRKPYNFILTKILNQK